MKIAVIVALCVLGLALSPALLYGFWVGVNAALVGMGVDIGTAKDLRFACMVILCLLLLVLFVAGTSV